MPSNSLTPTTPTSLVICSIAACSLGTTRSMESGPSRFQLSLAEFCRSTAAWRRRKADEYDRDERNLRTAAALEELATHILSLPSDDNRLLDLQRLARQGDDFLPDQRVLYE